MKLRGGQSAERRLHALRYWVEPRAAAWMRLNPRILSVTTAVAQYWSDEAMDAVHLRLIPSASPHPGWPVQDRIRDEAGFRAADAEVSGCPEPYQSELGDNLELVAAFAGCCSSGSHQDMDEDEAYQPWALTRRANPGVTSEVVGAVHQPRWEDRFWLPSRQDAPSVATPLQTRALRGEPLNMEMLLAAMDAGEALPVLLRDAEALLRSLRAWQQGGARDFAAEEAIERHVRNARYG